MIAMGCVAAAVSGVSNSQACAVQDTPSKLDYLVLARMADSPHLLGFGGYRSTEQVRADPRPAVKSEGAKPRDSLNKDSLNKKGN